MKTRAFTQIDLPMGHTSARCAIRAVIACSLLLALVAVAVRNTPAATAADNQISGDTEWTSLYNGSLDDFRIYFRGQGYIEDVNDQKVYLAEPGQIHVVKGTNGVIVTKVPYSYYHVKVDYRWGAKGGSKNAGLMTHVNLESDRVKDNRPRSVEINMKADAPGSIWLASGLGPFASTYVEKDTRRYLPKKDGGIAHNATPFGDRTILARYPDNKMNTNDYGEWNTLEAIVRGSESVEIILNGETVNHITNLRKPKQGTKEPGEPLIEGGIGLQSEGQEIFYRNFMIKKLTP
ncbi:MAG: DUF1080 domain-containing protein [Rhodospirillales bacterium]|nr:DUF1080 domain-containing protein [Rhodospirillales bacterium]